MDKKIKWSEKIKLFKKGIVILWNTSRMYLILIIIVSIFSGIIGPLNAIVYQKFLDKIVDMIKVNMWLESGLFLLVLFTIFTLLGYIFNGILQYIKQVFSDKLDLHITDSILNKSMKFTMETFDNVKIYNHINMAITQTSQNCLSLLDAISECIYALIKGFAFIFIIVRFNWIIVVISILSALPLLYISIKTNSYWYDIFYNRSEKLRLINYLKMILIKNENIKEIKLYNAGLKILKIIKDNFSKFIENDKKARKSILIKKMFSQSVDEIVSLFIKLWILILAISNGNSLGMIVLYFNSQENLKVSINELLNQFSVLHNSLLYLKSVDVIDKTVVQTNSNSTNFNPLFSKIEFKNISFKYPGRSELVLNNISLKFEKGKTYSIVGFNGSGKTTLIKLLLRLYRPTEGKILIDNIDIEKMDIDTYYDNISAIFQDFIKYPFDVFNNIVIRNTMPNENTLDLFNHAIDLADIRELIDSLPQKENTLLMRDWADGIDVSQGQWQKIAIARCFFNNSVISILDEPFSSIDAEAENRIISGINHEKGNKLTIFVTHRFSSISLADQIIVMKNGEVVEHGEHKDLIMNKNLYYKLYTTQLSKLNKQEILTSEETDKNKMQIINN